MPPQQGTSETGGRIDRNRNGRRMRSVVGQSLWSVTSGKCWASSSCSKTTSSCWRCKHEARARNAQTQLSEPAPEEGHKCFALWLLALVYTGQNPCHSVSRTVHLKPRL